MRSPNLDCRMFSKANQAHIDSDKTFDSTIFLIREIVLVNGKQREIHFFSELSFNDYNHLLSVLTLMMTPSEF